MKTVMKKLLSLALVAILLVSAVPFQASAAEDQGNVSVAVYLDDAALDTRSLLVTESTVLDEATGKSLLNFPDQYDFVRWENNSGVTVTDKPLPYSWVKTQGDYSLKLYIKTKPAAHVHDYKEVITKNATCKEKGVITLTCDCGATKGTKEIPLSEVHSYGDVVLNTSNNKNTQTCKDCGDVIEVSSKAHTITFYVDSSTSFTRYWNDNQYVTASDLPTPALADKYIFRGWYTKANGEGTKLVAPFTWEKNQDMTYYAYYQENPTGDKDGLSSLEVRMKVYNGSDIINDMPLKQVNVADGTKILKWLSDNEAEISDLVFQKVSSSKYEWVDREYYNNNVSAKLTEQDTVANGDNVVYIKVHLKDSQKTNVQLYIHQYDSKNKVYNTLKIVDVSGYKAGDTISLSKMTTVAKKYYSFKSIAGLYTDTAWKQLVAGQSPLASTSLTVEDGSTVKYHVVLTNAVAGTTTSKADTTNPKTGDMILVPAMVMLASAAAVAFVYISSKKRAVR